MLSTTVPLVRNTGSKVPPPVSRSSTATGAPMPLSSGALIMKQITVRGFWGSRVSAEMAPEERKRLITELVTLAAQGALRLDVGGTYGLDDVSEAVTAARTPGRSGKILLRG